METRDYLEELDADALADWHARVATCVAEVITDFGSRETNFRAEIGQGFVGASVEWIGFPERVASCLTRRESLRLFDAQPGLPGGRDVQEEYVEWRVVREGSRIRRIELTTELPEYWALLAAHEPHRLLELVAEFAHEDNVDPREVFGRADALERHVSPSERERAFRENMLEAGTSPYNDGRRAICCMRNQSNTLFSLAALAVAASTPRMVIDPLDRRRRALTSSESIALMVDGLAEPGRASDPLLVERFAQLAFEGRPIALDWPVGIYLQHFEPGRLLTPDGTQVPAEWFFFSRGFVTADGRRRYQRLAFEVPADEEFLISDLVDAATGRSIAFGGELADVVSVALFLRLGEEGKLPLSGMAVELDNTTQPNSCEELTKLYSNFLKA